MGDAGPIRVFLLDDHEVVRLGVAGLVDAEPDMAVVGQTGSGVDAVAAIGGSSPDVAVLDVRLGQADGEPDGIEVCRMLAESRPEIASLMLTSFADDHAIVDSAAAGAWGFVVKQIGGSELVEAIRQVAKGVRLLDAATVRLAEARIMDGPEGDFARLTPQERRIFILIGEGKTNRQIGAELYLAEKTVKNYVSNMLAKLNMSRRTEAAALAARLSERGMLGA